MILFYQLNQICDFLVLYPSTNEVQRKARIRYRKKHKCAFQHYGKFRGVFHWKTELFRAVLQTYILFSIFSFQWRKSPLAGNQGGFTARQCHCQHCSNQSNSPRLLLPGRQDKLKRYIPSNLCAHLEAQKASPYWCLRYCSFESFTSNCTF